MTKTESVDKNVTKAIEKSSKNYGQLYPVLVDVNGELIDGNNRTAVFKNQDKRKLDFVKTKKDRLSVRLVANHARKGNHESTWTETLEELALILQREGVEGIGMRIANDTGLPYRTIMKYLPDKFKDQAQSKRASNPRVQHCNPEVLPQEGETNLISTETNIVETVELPHLPKKVEEVLEDFKGVAKSELPKIELKTYSNQPWKAVILPKDFHTAFVRACEEARIDPEEVITLALVKALKDIKERLKCLTEERD